MMSKHKAELICDMAQYYHVHNFKDYSIVHLAILACGLPEDSRVMRTMNKRASSMENFLLSTIVDQNNLLIWQNGGCQGEKPTSISEKFWARETAPVSFDSGADFLTYRAQFVKG